MKALLTLITALLAIATFTAGAAAEDVPRGGLAAGVAENPHRAVTDRFHSLPPGSVKLEGFIQERIQQQADYLFDDKTLAEMVDAIRKQPHRIVNGAVTGLAEGEFWE